MGATASVTDLKELEEEYQKEKEHMTENQCTRIEKVYQETIQKGKSEFYVIGRCKKEFADIRSGKLPEEPKKTEKSNVAAFIKKTEDFSSSNSNMLLEALVQRRIGNQNNDDEENEDNIDNSETVIQEDKNDKDV